MTSRDRWLLPEGIEEILPDEARQLERLRRQALDLFASWGYELVMPPMLEYLDSLLTGVAKDLDLQTIKVTDQMTGRLMGVRADMTPQAARIDAHYLKRETPVRLCYLASVLRARPGEFATSREPLQLGAEFFGHAGPESDVEILRLMLATLAGTGIAAPYLDLGHVGVFRGLAAQTRFAPAQEAELFDALQRKAMPEVANLLADADMPGARKELFAALIELHGNGDVLAQARTRLAAAGAEVTRALDNLQAIADLLQRAEPRLSLHFDLAELQGYRYYTGVVFSAFVPGHGHAVAQGGRYDDIGKAFGRARPAAGFSADLRALAKLGAAETASYRCIAAPHADDAALAAAIAELRAQGECVAVQFGAADARCTRRLSKQNGRWTVTEAVVTKQS